MHHSDAPHNEGLATPIPTARRIVDTGAAELSETSADLLAWASNRPAWQQAALHQLAIGDSIETVVADGAVNCAGAACDPVTGLPTTGPGSEITTLLVAEDLPSDSAMATATHLVAIRDCHDVDAIAPGQRLTFAPTGLTVIYGDNGTGKSSYTRLLRSIGRSAGPGEQVEGHVFRDETPNRSAVIEYSNPDGAESFAWSPGASAPPHLSGIRVFDGASVAALVDTGTEVTYQPSGIHLLTGLADACKKIQTLLASERKNHEQARDIAGAQLARILGNHLDRQATSLLLADADELTAFEGVDALSDAEVARLKVAQEDLAALKPANAVAEQARISNEAKLVRIMADRIEAADTKLSDEAALRTQSQSALARIAREAAEEAALALEGDLLPGTGGEIWKRMWDAAQAFATTHAYPDHPWPAEHQGGRCVLCQQPLGANVVTRLLTLDEFVRSTFQADLDSALTRCADSRAALARIVLSTPEDDEFFNQPYLAKDDLGRQTRDYLAAARTRRDEMVEGIDAALNATAPPQEETVFPLNAPLSERLKCRAAELDEHAARIANPGDPAITALEEEISDLEARQTIQRVLPEIASQRRRVERIEHLRSQESGCTTNAITTIQRTLIAKAVTDALVDAFDAERLHLGYDQLKVRLVPTGQKGETRCNIEPVGNKRPIKIGRLLSNGERRGLALSALLAELSVVEDGAPLVIDDPVSSLDHAIRRRLAKRLAEESTRRQVVVFTHDPVFAFLLQEAATTVQPTGKTLTSIARQDIEKGADGVGQLRRTIADEAANVYDRLDQIRTALAAATELRDDGDYETWNAESVLIARALRNTWERAIEECLFKKAVVRFDRAVHTTVLDRVVVLPTDSALVNSSMKKLSLMMHDNASAIQEPPPTPDELRAEIKVLEDWRIEVKNRKHPETH